MGRLGAHDQAPYRFPLSPTVAHALRATFLRDTS